MRVPPQTPAEISVFLEGGAYVLRVGASQAIYTYDLDTAGRSNCRDQCAQLFPPVSAHDVTDLVGDWKVIRRTDGSRQWTYKNRPIYTYAEDLPGKTLADGMDGVWHVVSE
jgi:predicted lipoprotein with Yx(FWY)xxD motif